MLFKYCKSPHMMSLHNRIIPISSYEAVAEILCLKYSFSVVNCSCGAEILFSKTNCHVNHAEMAQFKTVTYAAALY